MQQRASTLAAAVARGSYKIIVGYRGEIISTERQGSRGQTVQRQTCMHGRVTRAIIPEVHRQCAADQA